MPAASRRERTLPNSTPAKKTQKTQSRKGKTEGGDWKKKHPAVFVGKNDRGDHDHDNNNTRNKRHNTPSMIMMMMEMKTTNITINMTILIKELMIEIKIH